MTEVQEDLASLFEAIQESGKRKERTPPPQKPTQNKGRKPSSKKAFDYCDPNDLTEEIIYILETTGDGVAQEDEVRKLLSAMASSCIVGASKGVKEVSKPKKRAMSGWNCYLKWCKDQSYQGKELDFQTCMKSSESNYAGTIGHAFREKEYNNKKDYWKEKAEKGCPL